MDIKAGTAYHLPSPCGSITVRDDKDNLVPFSLRAGGAATAFEAGSGAVYRNAHRYVIVLPAERLEAGRVYRIALDGIALGIGSTDECSLCVVGSGNGCSIAIGGSDPNQPEKYRRYLAHRSADDPPYSIAAEYDSDRSGFTRCDLYLLPDCSGFRFERLDDTCHEIVFIAAWTESHPDIVGETEAAVQFWVL